MLAVIETWDILSACMKILEAFHVRCFSKYPVCDGYFIHGNNNNYNNNNNNIQDNVYGVCHHGRAIARVHPVHLMNVELEGRS